MNTKYHAKEAGPFAKRTPANKVWMMANEIMANDEDVIIE